MVFQSIHSARVITPLIAVALLGAGTLAAQAASYELSAGFSPTSNPNGPWAYGWAGSVGGSFTALTVPFTSSADGGQPIPSWQLTTGNTPAVYKNTSGGTITIGGGTAS